MSFRRGNSVCRLNHSDKLRLTGLTTVKRNGVLVRNEIVRVDILAAKTRCTDDAGIEGLPMVNVGLENVPARCLETREERTATHKEYIIDIVDGETHRLEPHR